MERTILAIGSFSVMWAGENGVTVRRKNGYSDIVDWMVGHSAARGFLARYGQPPASTGERSRWFSDFDLWMEREGYGVAVAFVAHHSWEYPRRVTIYEDARYPVGLVISRSLSSERCGEIVEAIGDWQCHGSWSSELRGIVEVEERRMWAASVIERARDGGYVSERKLLCARRIEYAARVKFYERHGAAIRRETHRAA